MRENAARFNESNAALQESHNFLEHSLRSKEELIQKMNKEREDSVDGSKEQLKNLQASHDNLLAQNRALLSDAEVKNKEFQSLKEAAARSSQSNHALQESNQSLQQSIPSRMSRSKSWRKEA